MAKKHSFTVSEKNEFLRILKKYGPIVENKDTDGNTLRRKNIAWNRIACEYNTSSIAPYPATSKQLRRLWMNLKQRNKLTIAKIGRERLTSDGETSTGDKLEDVEMISIPYFVNVGESQDDTLKVPNITEATSRENDKLNATQSEDQAFSVKFIEELEDEEKPKKEHAAEQEDCRVKNNLRVREYQDRRRRLNELHLLQKRLLLEQIREAKAKANLAELELRQQQYLES